MTAMANPIKRGAIRLIHQDRASATAPMFCTPKNIKMHAVTTPMSHFAVFFLFSGVKSIYSSAFPTLFSIKQL